MASLRQRASGERTHSRTSAIVIVAGTRAERIELASVAHALEASV